MNAPDETKPGIYPDMTNEAYHSGPGISKSGLDLINRSPYLFRNRPPVEQTKAMLIGSATHTAVLERDLFADQYVWAPKVDARTKAGKEELALFAADNEGKIVLKSEEFDQVCNISRAVWSNQVAAKMLSEPGKAESSIFQTDNETGELIKVRPDWMFDNLLVDLKTTEDASPEAFSRSCWNYRYHVQAALYLDVANSIFPNQFSGFVFIVVEKSAPFQVAVYYADQAMIEAGRIQYRENLNLYHDCRVSDVWPGINDGKISPIGLPGWALKNLETAIAA